MVARRGVSGSIFDDGTSGGTKFHLCRQLSTSHTLGMERPDTVPPMALVRRTLAPAGRTCARTSTFLMRRSPGRQGSGGTKMRLRSIHRRGFCFRGLAVQESDRLRRV